MHSRFQAALTTLAADLQAAIAPMLADPHFPALLEADQVATLQHATGLDEDALAYGMEYTVALLSGRCCLQAL